MNWTTQIGAEFARLNKHPDDSVVEELAQHAAAAFEAARADGDSPADAEARVRALITSWCDGTSGPRRIERLPLIESAAPSSSPFSGLALDLRNAVRLIRRQPGFAVASIVMIALGIAATTSIFTVVNGVLLRPLPWPNADRIVRVFESREGDARTAAERLFTNVPYQQWNENPQTVVGLGGWQEGTLRTAADAGGENVLSAQISVSLFPLLGVVPMVGTNFTPAQELTDDTVLLSYGFWRERFGGDPNIVGKSVVLGGKARVIVGVMPAGFWFPARTTRVWTPYRVQTAYQAGSKDWSIRIQPAIALLKRGVTPDQAASEATARANAEIPNPEVARIRESLSGSNARVKITTTPVLDLLVNDVKPALLLLLAAVGLLFVAAIGNVVNMQLAQAAARQREVAIRAAIGAGTRRLTRQLFVETGTIALVGGAVGFGLTLLALRALPAALPADLPRSEDIALDARVLTLVTGLITAASVAAAFLPSRMARRLKLTSALADDGSAPVGHSLRSPVARSRALVITAQVAIAAVLLVGASLLVQSFVKLVHFDRGYTPANLMTARVRLLGPSTAPAMRATFYEDLLARIAGMPRVTHVGLVDSLPLTPKPGEVDFYVSERSRSMIADGKALRSVVSADYFGATGMRIVSGRGFTPEDSRGTEPVIVVNEALARQFFAGDALNKYLYGGFAAAYGTGEFGGPGPAWRVIGVVADVRHGGAREPVRPQTYIPFGRVTGGAALTEYLTVRTEGDPAAIAADLRAIIRGSGAETRLDQVLTMETRVLNSLTKPRLYAVVLGGFATFAVLIAGVGLFGGLSYSVTQRRREIGVRTALGATPRDIVSLVLRPGGVMVLVGLVIGFGLAVWTGRFLEGFLFGVTKVDLSTYVIVACGLLVIAMLACAMPARRAAKIDALVALRR